MPTTTAPPTPDDEPPAGGTPPVSHRVGTFASMGQLRARSCRGPAVVGALTVFAVGTSAGCSPAALDQEPDALATAPIVTQFSYDPADARPPVTAHLALPPAGAGPAEIVVVMPSGERTAEEEAAVWGDVVADRDVIVVVPEIGGASGTAIDGSDESDGSDRPGEDTPTADSFAGSSPTDPGYPIGGMLDENGYAQPASTWTWSLVDDLVEQVRLKTGCSDPEYSLFGHGAGAQFVTRAVEFNTTDQLQSAVAANADWYTLPDDGARFPYGLDGVEPDEADLEGALAAPLTILVGEHDTGQGAVGSRLAGVDRSAEQGATRIERGHTFYSAGRRLADEHDWSFRWRIAEVPGVGHDDAGMARAALTYLLGPDDS